MENVFKPISMEDGYVKKRDVQACLEQLAAEHLIGNDFDTFISLPEAQDKIEELTVVEVKPVKYGTWIPASTKPGVHAGMKCSECKARITYSKHFNGQHLYCHKCGAKMVKETGLKSTFTTYAGVPGYEAAGKE